jgi:hypothetical protein
VDQAPSRCQGGRMKPDAPALYAVVDRRQDGTRRIVGEYVDPRAAAAAAEQLRAAGAVDVTVELISRVDPLT